ncbi:MAG: hypothetical protein ACREJ2_11640 [Planctomycetota bacterium]
MSANPALSHSPAELEAFLERTEERLKVLKDVRHLREKRSFHQAATSEIDGKLEQLAEPLRLALLEAPAPLPELPAAEASAADGQLLAGLRRYALQAKLPEQLLLAELLALAAHSIVCGVTTTTCNLKLIDLQECAAGWCGTAGLIP